MMDKGNKSLLIRNKLLGKISDEEFLKNFLRERSEDPNFPQKIFRRAYADKDVRELEFGIILFWALEKEGFPKLDADICCKLLSEKWHFSHEDIAFILAQMKDPATVDCLYKGATIKLNYLLCDENFQLARKCIKALAAIGTDLAIEKIKKLALNENEVVRLYAEKELRYKGLA